MRLFNFTLTAVYAVAVLVVVFDLFIWRNV
jgi:hypothetical protein